MVTGVGVSAFIRAMTASVFAAPIPTGSEAVVLADCASAVPGYRLFVWQF